MARQLLYKVSSYLLSKSFLSHWTLGGVRLDGKYLLYIYTTGVTHQSQSTEMQVLTTSTIISTLQKLRIQTGH